MFFHYRQNNSGGSFQGPAINVIIEAPMYVIANDIAETNNLYFSGCDTGQDCSCCGDRWSAAWGNDGDTEPMVYGKPVAEYLDAKADFTLGTNRDYYKTSMYDGILPVLVIYQDGTRKEYN